MTAQLLIVDDELSMREFLTILLEREGYQVSQAESAESALKMVECKTFDVILSDVNMPGLSGFDLLRYVKEITPETSVLLITAYSTTEKAVEAMKLGAYDYIAKPFKVEEIKVLVSKALEKRNLQAENRRLHREVENRYSFSGLIGKSMQMQELFGLIEKVAQSPATVLISGESGTGKELVAKAIHYNSPRRKKPFVAINSGAIPESLMESELFGHVKGAYTGAMADVSGLFEQADGGTLFLDEIGEVPLALQAKLLRALQEKEVRRIGSSEDRKVDVRVVAASNRDLAACVRQGFFREDLYYRLNVIELHLPALRERSEDIPLLAQYFFTKNVKHEPAGEVISREALPYLLSYPFPGNVRELENLVERSVAFGASQICLESLPPHMLEQACRRVDVSLPAIPVQGMNMEKYLDTIEQHLLEEALRISGGMKKRAASLLGLTFRSFRYRLKKFGMDDDNEQENL